MTCTFSFRCIKYFLHLLFNSLIPTLPASRAVTDWDVSAHRDHFLISHGSSNMPFLTDTGLGHKLAQGAPLSSRSHSASKGIFQPVTVGPSVIIPKWVGSVQALATQPLGSTSSWGAGYVQPWVQFLPASLFFKAISAMHELSDKVKCAKTLQAPAATLIFIVSP